MKCADPHTPNLPRSQRGHTDFGVGEGNKTLGGKKQTKLTLFGEVQSEEGAGNWV